MTGTPEAGMTGAMPAGEIQQRLINGTSWTAINVAVTLPLAFIVNLIIARALGVDGYGELAYLTAVITTVGVAASMGSTNAAVTFATAAETAGDSMGSTLILQRLLGYTLLFKVPIVVAVIIILTWTEPRWVTWVLITTTILTAWTVALINSLAVEHRTATNAKITTLSSLLTMAGSVAAAVATGRAAAVWGTRHALEGLSMAVFALQANKRRRRQLVRPMPPRGFPPGFWKFAVSTGAAGLMGILVFSRSEVFLLEWMGQDMALGLFALAFGLSVHVIAPLEAMLGPLVPAAAGLVAQHPAQVPLAFDRMTRVASLTVGCVIVTAIPGLAILIPIFYGEGFAGTASIFVILAIMSGLRLVGRIAEAFVNGRRRGGVLLRANMISLLIGTLLAIAVIPVLGVWGAVIGNVAGQSIALGLIVTSEIKAQGSSLGAYLRLTRVTILAVPIGVLAALLGLSAGHHPLVAAPVSALAGLAALYVVVRLGPRPPLEEGDISGIRAYLPTRIGGLLQRTLVSCRLV